jgi:hypothetical protein
MNDGKIINEKIIRFGDAAILFFDTSKNKIYFFQRENINYVENAKEWTP